MVEYIDKANFMLVASRAFLPQYTEDEEFEDELKRIDYLKKLFKKYRLHGILKERLILNHLIVMYNVFEHTTLTRMLVFKLEEYLDLLKPFLLELNYFPKQVEGIGKNGGVIMTNEIPSNQYIVNVLKNI